MHMLDVPKLNILHFTQMQMRARESAAYYSCDDHFVVVDKTIDYGRGGSMPDKPSAPEVRIQALGTGTTQNVTGILSRGFLRSLYANIK
jgi:hypothetical protein